MEGKKSVLNWEAHLSSETQSKWNTTFLLSLYKTELRLNAANELKH